MKCLPGHPSEERKVPSPFPGMDPYIESWIWGDFHARLIPAIYDQLSPRLPDRYVASTELFVWRVDESAQERTLTGGPEIFMSESGRSTSATAAAVAAAPINSVLPGVVRKQKHIKVIDRLGRRVVTVIECLSPSNKAGSGDGQAYRLKREEYVSSGLNLVEIDLLRNGIRPPLGNPAPPIVDYYVLVNRGDNAGAFGIWPFSVREAFPSVCVPLDPDVADVTIDLKACFDHVYDIGRYAVQFDYALPPSIPLREPDAAWARELLGSRAAPRDA